MRMAYVCVDPGVPVFGRKGSSIHCQEVLRAFLKEGWEIELFATRFGKDVPKDLRNITCHELGHPLPRDAAARERAIVKLNTLFAHYLELSQPFDMVYERFSLWSFAAMQFAFERRLPGVLEVNSPLIEEQKTHRSLINEEAAKHIRGKCFRYATSMVAVSQSVADRLEQNYFSQDKATVIPNGVNCQTFFPQIAADPGIIDKPAVIGFVGTLKPWHGVDKLLDAFSIVHESNPNTRLRIVGDGPQRSNLHELVSKLPVETAKAVEFVGAVPNHQIPEILSSLDIAVAPYPEITNFYFSPLKILEYMATGLPVVASALGQIPGMIQHNVTGLLVKPGCKYQLSKSILNLCGDMPARRRLGLAARGFVESNYTWESVVQRIVATIPVSPCSLTPCGMK